MQEITFETLPKAVQTITEQLQVLTAKIDNLPTPEIPKQELDENRYVDINEIRQTIFTQWAKQTIYNKCYKGELPHSRIGARLMFHYKECREWRDQQLQQGKIKALSQIEDEAKAFVQRKVKGGKI
jgi:predicted DNA-binding transcriptional regulator AlpA